MDRKIEAIMTREAGYGQVSDDSERSENELVEGEELVATITAMLTLARK